MKGNWKKLWGFLLLSSILLISLTACGKKEKGKETDNSVVGMVMKKTIKHQLLNPLKPRRILRAQL